MSIPGIAEQITLDSGETELASITPIKENLKKVTLELVQQNKLHKTQRQVRIFDHKTLYVKEMVGKQARHILFDLSLINEKPVRMRSFNTTTLIASFLASVFAVVSLYIQAKGILNVPALYMYGATGVFALAAIACGVFTVKSYKDSWVFLTAHGRVPVLTLFNKLPDKGKFTQFSKAIINNIELARSNNTISTSKLMPAIVGEHRRLFEKQFISEQEFDQAKKNILSSSQ